MHPTQNPERKAHDFSQLSRCSSAPAVNQNAWTGTLRVLSTAGRGSSSPPHFETSCGESIGASCGSHASAYLDGGAVLSTARALSHARAFPPLLIRLQLQNIFAAIKPMRRQITARLSVRLHIIAELLLHPRRLPPQILSGRVLLQDRPLIPIDLLLDHFHGAKLSNLFEKAMAVRPGRRPSRHPSKTRERHPRPHWNEHSALPRVRVPLPTTL